jgi:hypothetical protein
VIRILKQQAIAACGLDGIKQPAALAHFHRVNALTRRRLADNGLYYVARFERGLVAEGYSFHDVFLSVKLRQPCCAHSGSYQTVTRAGTQAC